MSIEEIKEVVAKEAFKTTKISEVNWKWENLSSDDKISLMDGVASLHAKIALKELWGTLCKDGYGNDMNIFYAISKKQQEL